MTRVAKRDREEVRRDQAIAEALHRVVLAIGEVRVVERKAEGQVVGRRVVNREALARARRAYQAAAIMVGKARAADSLTVGPQRPPRPALRQAMDTLLDHARTLGRLELDAGDAE
jgi:hypothetical protein